MISTLEAPVAEIVARYKAGASVRSVARAVGRSHATVFRHLKNQKVALRATGGQRIVTPDDEVVARYEAGETMEQIAGTLGCDRITIRNRLIARGVEPRIGGSSERTYAVNENFFDNIETEVQAYWLGFLLADGSNSGQAIKVKLAAKDRDHLVKFAVSIESEHPITDEIAVRDGREYPQVVLRVNSVHMCKSLAALECFQRKTCDHGTPKLSADLMRHMYRGYQDGDGWISPASRGSGWVLGVAGGYRFIRAYRRWLMDNVGLNKVKLNHPSRAYTFTYSGRQQVARIGEVLYAGSSVYLQRKFERYQQLLQYNKNYRRKNAAN